MTVKFLLGLVIIGFTSYCGYLLSRKYRVRALFFKQLREFNDRFLNEMSYYRRPLVEFFGKYSYKGEFGFLLDDFLSNLRSGQVFYDKLFESADYDFIKKDEKSFIADYLSMLGKGDSNSQKAYFSSIKDSVKTMETQAQETGKKYTDLYIKLGFLCGLFILILII